MFTPEHKGIWNGENTYQTKLPGYLIRSQDLRQISDRMQYSRLTLRRTVHIIT